MNKKVLNVDIGPFDLIRYKNEGMVPCYYDNGLKIFDTPTPKGERKLFGVYLIEKGKYDKIVELENKMNERIELELKKIELLKQMVPSVLNELTKNDVR
jgi:hypothetical protein